MVSPMQGRQPVRHCLEVYAVLLECGSNRQDIQAKPCRCIERETGIVKSHTGHIWNHAE